MTYVCIKYKILTLLDTKLNYQYTNIQSVTVIYYCNT